MKQNRWFILALCFLLLNGYAVFQWLEKIEKPETVQATLSLPEDGRVVPQSRDVVGWSFSQEMVSADQLGQWTNSGPVSFSPEVKGGYCWNAADELWFRPSAGWAACTPFTALFDDGLRSLSGKPLDGKKVSVFSSGPLALKSIRQSNVAGSGSTQLDFEFSEAVPMALLWKYLNVRDADGKPVAVSKSGSRSARRMLRVTLSSFTKGELEVTVRKGLTSSAGPLGLESDEVRKVTVTRDLRILRVVPKRPSFDGGQINVTLNAPVDPLRLKEFIRIEPEIKFSVETQNAWGGRQYLRILADFEPGSNYTLTFCKGVRSDQDIHLKEDDVRTVYFPGHSSLLKFVAGGIYLSTQGNLSIPFKAVNSGPCTVKITRVYSNNLVQLVMRKTGRIRSYYGSAYQGLEQQVAEFELPIDAVANEVVERRLALRDRLEGKTGAFHVAIKGERGGASFHHFVVSDLGLSLRQSGSDMLVWVNSIRTLAPVGSAEVRILSEQNQLLLSGKTGPDGLLRLNPENMPTEGTPFLLVVEKGDDLTYMRLDNSLVNLRGATGTRGYLKDGYEAFLFTDRGIYRPGETVHCKAVVRGPNAVCPDTFPLELSVIRPDGKIDRTLSGMLGDFGTTGFDVTLADYVATGKYRLQLKVPGGEKPIGEIMLSVEEFVPPQIRTTLHIPEGRVPAGKDQAFKVIGQHLFGRPAADLPVRARVDFMPCGFAPVEWAKYAFGDARRPFETVQKVLGRKQLDADGKQEFVLETTASWRPPAALKAIISGTVQETGGRTVTEYGSCMIDVYSSYIGIRRPDESLETRKEHAFDLAVVAPDGSLVVEDGSLQVRVEKLNWVTVMRQEGDHFAYRSEQQAVEMKTCDVTVTNGRASVSYLADRSGTYRLVVEDKNSATASSLQFYVSSPGQQWTERSMTAPDQVELELDRASYRVGDTARLAIRSPFAGKALLTIESDRILSHRVLELTNNTVEVEVPVEAVYCPNVYCSISVLRPALPEEVWGQHRAVGRIPLLVEQTDRRLEISLDLPKQIRPQTRLEIPVQVTDAKGAGCKSELVLAAVDEGICMLTGFKTPDPYTYFFGPRLPGMVLHDLYAQLMPEALDLVAGNPSAPGGGMFAAIGKRLNPIKARRFKPVALWSSSVVTDTNGQAVVTFDVPEFTGQLRIMAVSVDRSRFGSAAQSLLVKRPLVVQSSLPRFLAPEDECTMPVRVYNETASDGEVLVAVGCEGPLQCLERSNTVFLAAGSATNLEFQLQAFPMPGKAVCTLMATMGAERFSESIEIAVRPAAPRVVHCGSEKVTAGTDAEIQLPQKWLEGTGVASLQLSGLPTVNLGAGLDYLINYPYGCLEQTTSKSFPLLYLSELVEQTRPGWLGKEGTTEFVHAGIHRILSMQQSNGGFSLWPHGAIYDWGSIYATHFLVEASRAGYDVPKERLDEALGYVEKKIRNASYDHTNWDYNATYGCFVLALGDRPQHGAVSRLTEKWSDLRYDSRINLICALLASDRRRQAVDLLEILGDPTASPVPRETRGSLRSPVRCNAFLLSALLDVDPENQGIATLVRWLDDARSNGRWRHTQDNAMALMALGKYTKRLTPEPYSLLGRVSWNGGATSTGFKSDGELRIALDSLSNEVVRIENRSEGELYLTWTSEGVPADGEVDEHDRSIRIRRTLLDLKGQPVDPMTLRQGELYVVQLRLSAEAVMDNLVIEDLLPAGLEVENGALKTSQSASWMRSRQTLKMQHLDIRDDRVIAFPSKLHGDKTYCYAVRAVTAGSFVWPAVSVSCMYDASIESIHGKGRVQVVAE